MCCSGLNDREDITMKQNYETPEIEVIQFESEDIITASGDYTGINFESLI